MSQNRILKSDITDTDFVDAYELRSDGYTLFLTVTIASTAFGTNIVTLNSPFTLNTYDDPVEVGDRFRLLGSSGADGYYLIDQILSPTTFTTIEPINNSTGGDGYFMYISGALRVGFDRQRYPAVNVVHDNVQEAIEDLDKAISGGGGGLTPAQHATLRQLIHLADGVGGPYEGFPTNAYREITPLNAAFPTSIIWYTSSAKVAKYVEKTVTYNPNKTPAIIEWKAYNTDGVTVLSTVTDTITYSGPFELYRIRGIVDSGVIVGTLTIETHKYVRQLIHLADGVGGPFEGFTTGAYREILPAANIFPTSIIWYDDITKTKKIVEKTIAYNTNKTVSLVSWKVYDVDGTTVLATVTDTPTYSGVFELDRTRAIT